MGDSTRGERWEHESLLPAGTSPTRTPPRRAGGAEAAWWAPGTGGGEAAASPPADSPLDGWELETAFPQEAEVGAGVRHSGWLLKANGQGQAWNRRFVYLTADRLCHTPDPGAGSARYLPLDRIPVRALPRGYGPKLGVALVEDRQVDRSHPQFSPKKAGCVFSVACGAHTHYFAAPSPGEARAWVEAITQAWLECVKHTARGTASPSASEAFALREAALRSQADALRRSVAEAAQARLRESTAAWRAAAVEARPVDEEVSCYEIEVVTGRQPEAGTTSRVYLELCGAAGSSGEHRLTYGDERAARAAFSAGATDSFRLHCAPLGTLLKVRVYHSNAGPHPSWFLQEVRVRQQGSPAWTLFPCGRWLAVHEDDGRVLRELPVSGSQAPAEPAAPPPPPAAALPQPQPQPVAAERVVPPVWYTVAVCTGGEEGAGLAPPTSAVFLVLHGTRGSSQRVKLPSQAGDFERGQEDVFRVQLPCVGQLEKLAVAVASGGEPACWLLEQVEVTDEATGETVYFPCSAWLGAGKGAAPERCLLCSGANPREARREAARLRQQVEAAQRQLAEAQAELVAVRAAANGVEQASRGQQAELEGRLSALQEEQEALRRAAAEAQASAAAAEAQAAAVRAELAAAAERAASLQREQEAGRQRAGSDAAHAAQLASQLAALHDDLAEAQEAAAAAAARARKSEADARRAEEVLQELRSQQEDEAHASNSSAANAEGELRRLRAEVAAREAELREAKEAEASAAAECNRLGRDLAAERLRAKEAQEEAEKAAAAAAAAAVMAPAPVDAPAAAGPSACLQASYRVCVRTSSEPANAGTCQPVWVELVGRLGSTGAIALDRRGSTTAFAAGASDVFQLEAPAVGDLQQLNIWVEGERGGGNNGSGGLIAAAGSRTKASIAAATAATPTGAAGTPEDAAAWHLDSVEVAVQGTRPQRSSYFLCRRWLDARCGYRAELPASALHPRGELEYQIVVHTSSVAGGGTAGNVCLDLTGDASSSGVLTLRNKGGSFRPGQADAFTFRLPNLGALSELRVGHDGRRDWHLERVEVSEPTSGTTYFFPCARWVPSGAMSRALQLRGYTTDPGALPVRYRAEVQVEAVGTAPPPDGLRLTLFGGRGESGQQRVDASRAVPGRALTAWFEAPNVGPMERLRIGLAPAPPGQQSSLLVSRVTLTNMPTGEAATFHCSEWLRSADPFDLELDAEAAGQEQEETLCTYRVEVCTSDVRKAGTAGSVYLTILGDAGTIGPYQLTNTEAEHFQRGQLDVFEVEGAPDCGRLQQIEVRHGGQKKGDGWHLAWIKVNNASTGAVAMFKCNRWVDRRGLGDPGAVAAVTALPPDAAAAAAGVQRSAKDRALLQKGKALALRAPGGVAAAAAAQAPLVPDRRMEADLGGTAGVVESATGPVAGPPAGPPGYRIAFHTSRMCGSGTHAKVHLEVMGSGGSSGVLHPRGTSRSFGAGRLDIFEYPALPFLGDLHAARVGTDGSGFFPGWHLALLVVTHLPTGRVWQFSCYNWIDKKCNYSRWLQLDIAREGQAPGYGTNTAAAKLAAAAAASAALAASPAGTPTAWGQQSQASSRRGSALMRGEGSGAYAYAHSPHAPQYLGGGPPGPPRHSGGSAGGFSPLSTGGDGNSFNPLNFQPQTVSTPGSPVRAAKRALAVPRPGSPGHGQGWQQQQHGWQQQSWQHGGSRPGSPLIAAGRPHVVY